MRIAQVAPLYESVPPRLYGGTERIVSFLTEELVRQGHDVTLFASGDSKTSADLVPVCAQGLRLDSRCRDATPHHVLQLQRIMERSKDFDLVHFHSDYLHFPLVRESEIPHITTLHGRLDLPDIRALYREFSDLPFVSISNSQRKPLAGSTWKGTVYHGLPKDLLSFKNEEGEYLAFMGRVSPEKGPVTAIEIARRAGMPLKIAAKIDSADRAYFEAQVYPRLDPPHVEFVGEINERQKNDFLAKAKALLFPIDWPEPFGLVMIEAMACGVPVIAYGAGSVPEVLDHEKSGFIVNSVEEALAAIRRLPELSKAECRRTFEMRFSVERMAHDYLRIYERVIRSYEQSRRTREGAAESGSQIAGTRRDDLYPGEFTFS